jgi:hypothetical protein
MRGRRRTSEQCALSAIDVMSDFGTPQYWRNKAQQSRQIAKQISLKEARVLLLNIAEQYDALVVRSDQAGGSFSSG